MLRILQKSESPVLECLPSPPFESELKRATAQKTLTVTKQQVQVDLGTSVVPRQRPKGNVSTQNLPLVSSPSPRNAITSPSPQVLQTNESNLEASGKTNNLSQSSTPYVLKQTASGIQNELKTPTKLGATESLFGAKFSDSFSDTTNSPQMSSAIATKDDFHSPTSPMHQKLLGTPTSTAGHRRNMSDTTAFNK